VACVRTADTTSTAVSGTDGAGTGGCSAVALTNGQAYSYKVFQKDSNGNYDAGVTFTGSPFTPAAASITLIVDTDQFPALTPETPRFATSTVSVNTNNTTGWYVTLERSDADTTMDLDTDATVNIIDKTEWIAGASTSTESSQPATTITSGQDFLAFRAMTASSTNGSMFFASTWWGSDDTPFTNAKWAGIASSTAATNLKKIGISSVSSGGSPALNTVQYYLDVPITQKTGAYSGTVIFTAVMN
ncbi:hypothetical protein KKB69_00845, partial [Patescibacteria group bacterium]|nr:hypothetical protein [Patescibacteria group bacterium]